MFTDRKIGTKSSRPKNATAQLLDVEEKKLALYARKLDKENIEEDADVLWLRSLAPDVKKAKNVRQLKLKIQEVINDHLETEELLLFS